MLLLGHAGSYIWTNNWYSGYCTVSPVSAHNILQLDLFPDMWIKVYWVKSSYGLIGCLVKAVWPPCCTVTLLQLLTQPFFFYLKRATFLPGGNWMQNWTYFDLLYWFVHFVIYILYKSDCWVTRRLRVSSFFFWLFYTELQWCWHQTFRASFTNPCKMNVEIIIIIFIKSYFKSHFNSIPEARHPFLMYSHIDSNRKYLLFWSDLQL